MQTGSVFSQAPDHDLRVEYSGMYAARGLVPLPKTRHKKRFKFQSGMLHEKRSHLTVQIAPRERAPVVSVDDAVGVKHWHYLEDKVISEDLGVESGADEVIYDAFHHPTGICLSRMDTRSDHNALTQLSRRMKQHYTTRTGGYNEGGGGGGA